MDLIAQAIETTKQDLINIFFKPFFE